MAAAPLAGVAVGKLVVVAVSAPACSVVVPGSWLLELALGTLPFVSVLTSQMLSEKSTSAVPVATNPPSLVSRTEVKLLKSVAGRKTCCQDSAPVAVVLASHEAVVGPLFCANPSVPARM